jgi:hypothetical protein
MTDIAVDIVNSDVWDDQGTEIWVLMIDLFLDGFKDPNGLTYILPTDTVEWRMAELEIDDKEEITQLVLLEPHLYLADGITGFEHPDSMVNNPDVKANQRLARKRVRDVKGKVKGVVGFPPGQVARPLNGRKLEGSGSQLDPHALFHDRSPVDDDVKELKRNLARVKFRRGNPKDHKPNRNQLDRVIQKRGRAGLAKILGAVEPDDVATPDNSQLRRPDHDINIGLNSYNDPSPEDLSLRSDNLSTRRLAVDATRMILRGP